MRFRSSAPSLQWPAIPSPYDARVIALLHQFQESQWWSRDELRKAQTNQLRLLLQYYRINSKFFYDHYGDAVNGSYAKFELGDLSNLPTLTRSDMRLAGENLFNLTIPDGHSELRSSSSSGSSGPPVTIYKTDVNQIFHEALNLRNHIWHQRQFSETFATIRRFPEGQYMPPDGATEATWLDCIHTGKFLGLNSAFCAIDEQLEWLFQKKPAYLFSYPSLLFELAQRCISQGLKPTFLMGLMTFGEVLSTSQRQHIKTGLGLTVKDTYSASEVSKIGIQCPEYEENYHLMSESLFVEILDNHHKPCKPGEAGRVVVTDLHNFITPLIRYELGDIARVGEPCPCGRGLPVITEIVGRTLSALKLPNGDSLIPDIERQDFASIAPIEQIQVIQRSYTLMEVKIVCPVQLNKGVMEALSRAVLRGLHNGHYKLEFVFVNKIERKLSGKFEAFICEMDDESTGHTN